MTHRRKARELALQTLYAHELNGDEDIRVVFRGVVEIDEQVDPDACEYARELAQKTVAARDTIDAYIVRHAANWDLKRMAVIDRNIIRMAVAEMLYCPDVPYKVVIDEAVELAKAFGTHKSGGFVNGIIDSVRKEIGAASA